jgi:putative ATP-binding cassette transporter
MPDAESATGLDRLASSIDQAARWDKELSFDEQQLLVFTRMLLHKPHCVVIDEALDTFTSPNLDLGLV